MLSTEDKAYSEYIQYLEDTHEERRAFYDSHDLRAMAVRASELGRPLTDDEVKEFERK